MKLGAYYRGVYLKRLNLSSISQRDCYGGEWTDLWLGVNGDRPMTWNAACAWVDSVSDLPDECGYEGPPFYCGECGERELLHWIETHRATLLARQLCNSCNHWFDWQARSERDPSMFVAGGTTYTIGSESRRGMRGFGGARHVIEWPDGRRVTTTNLWTQGEVPPRWRERLPDTARFVREHVTEVKP